MPIETNCQGCGKRLRVSDEHAGKLAKCPQCQTVYTVPSSPQAVALGAGAISPAGPPGADRWHMKTTDGLTFGPVSKHELDRWLSEGRILATSQILHEGDGQWVWAGQVYPQLQNFTADSPFKPMGTVEGQNPYASPNVFAPGYYGGRPFREAHRGGAILTMSIVGLLLCPVLAIAAFIMAIIDLGKMQRGTMDPSGKGLTIAGLVISCIPLVVFIIHLATRIAGN